jgi:hypothetical protein
VDPFVGTNALLAGLEQRISSLEPEQRPTVSTLFKAVQLQADRWGNTGYGVTGLHLRLLLHNGLLFLNEEQESYLRTDFFQ